MCRLGWAHTGDACGTPADLLVGAPQGGFTGNFRSPGTTNSLQVDTNAQTGQIQIDVDQWNPSDGLLGAALHNLLQVLPNKIGGTDNTYGCKR